MTDDPTRDLNSERPGIRRRSGRIGAYKVLSRIGEGGMGVVYLAEQEAPIRRRVALKVIRPGMGSHAVIARFEAERQALAMMDHPTIAKVYEAGTTSDGNPFFAMEHVKGISLIDYCDRQRLLLRERLSLFTEVCYGVQHAHQKAVIHRDLKPSNILVTEVGGKPTPKIIDFGLAKALGGQQLSERSLFTEQGALVGTPEYMSPEQVDPTALDVDTRTDVYSLGVILYQILTSTLPFDTKDLQKAAQIAVVLSIRKRICEQELQKPSTRVSSSAGVAADAAKKSKLEPATLARRIRGDLDWITMKALEKDRGRRYATPMELAADIQRHLRHEPVTAGPPGTAYRLKKFVRKNLGAVIALGAVFLALLAGAATTTIFYLRSEERRGEAETARTLAQLNEELAREKEIEAVAARGREKEQREVAEAARKEAERQRDEVLRLSDIQRLRELVSEADELWPADPEKVEAMVDWHRRARELTSNLATHQASLEKLRESLSDSEGVRGPFEAEGTSGESEEWRFPDTETQWRHDTLAELVTGLERFSDSDPKVGTVADLGKRLAFARTVRQETIEKYSVEWEEAIASIRDECLQYDGFELEPQLGLVPIGRDPVSGLWEFAHLQTGAVPDRTAEGSLRLAAEMGIVFVLLPGGTFRMGAQSQDERVANFDADAESHEGPVHEVSLDPFFLSKFEVTQAQWERFVGRNPSRYGARGYRADWDRNPAWQREKLKGQHPVEQVSWEDCQRVTARLGLLLPTEAQWEYAARSGTSTVFSSGNDVASLSGVANLADGYAKSNGGNSSWIYEEELVDGYTAHAPVGRFRANRFGLHDMHGNVWEWCRDGYGAYGNPANPKDGERSVPDPKTRINRGGSCSDSAAYARSAHREDYPPELRLASIGCRFSKGVAP